MLVMWKGVQWLEEVEKMSWKWMYFISFSNTWLTPISEKKVEKNVIRIWGKEE